MKKNTPYGKITTPEYIYKHDFFECSLSNLKNISCFHSYRSLWNLA